MSLNPLFYGRIGSYVAEGSRKEGRMLVDENLTVRVEDWKIAPHVAEMEASIIREILKISAQPGVISFAGGLPAPELFPL